MKFHPVISVISGIIAAITIFGISMLIFGMIPWIPGVAGFALIIGGFIATYFSEEEKLKHGTYKRTKFAALFEGITFAALFIIYYEVNIGYTPLAAIPITFVFMLVIFSVIVGIGGLIGEAADKHGSIGKKVDKFLKQKNIENRTIYCPQCGLKNLDSKLCTSCGENLQTARNYIKRRRYLDFISAIFLLAFILSLIILGNMSNSDSFIIIPFLLFILLIISFFSPTVLDKLIILLSGQARRYCPKCEHSNFNEKYCIKCGYNLENVLGCFSGNIGVDLNDIELNKNYINLYRHIIERASDGPGEYYERLAPRTLSLGSIRNMRLSKCKTLLIFPKPCLKFEYGGIPIEFKMSKRTIHKVDKILSSGVYDKLIHKDN